MRVAHVTSVHSPDDVRIYVKECRTLRQAGYDILLIAPEGRVPEDGGPGITVITLKRRKGRVVRMLRTTWDVFSAVRRLGARIVHFHDPELIPIGLMLKLTGRRVVYDVHENMPDQIREKRWLPRFVRPVMARVTDAIERLGGRVFDAIVAATPRIAERFPPGRTVVVQNFPLLSEFSYEDGCSEWNRRKTLVYVGGITRARGIVEIVSAMEIVQEAAPELRLAIAGKFQEESLEEHVRSMRGWSSVQFLGWQRRDEVSQLLSTALTGLVVLHPCRNYLDSYPVKLFEYMAAGIPVIAADFPLWRRIVDEAGCGLLVDPSDVAGIAEAALWLFRHQEEAREMGMRGAVAVRTRYNWDQQREKLLGLYARLRAAG